MIDRTSCDAWKFEKKKQEDGMRSGTPARDRPVIAHMIVKGRKGETVRRPHRDGTGELVARRVRIMTLYHTFSRRVTLQHDRGDERARIRAWVYVLICSALLLGLLHEPQNFRPRWVDDV